MLVKDEADIIEATVRHLLTQLDYIVVADNMSSDGTYDILEGLAHGDADGSMMLVRDEEVGYYQSRKTTAIAQSAMLLGHDWVVPCDADEIWYSTFGRLADVIEENGRASDLLTAELFDHVPTRVDDPFENDPTRRIRWRRRARGVLPKIAARLTPGLSIGMGNHNAFHNDLQTRTTEWAVSIRHFPYRSEEQFVRKAINGAAAYAATDLPEDFGGHWRGYGAMVADHGEQAAVDWYHAWFYSDDPPLPPAAARVVAEGEEETPTLIEDPAPIGRAT